RTDDIVAAVSASGDVLVAAVVDGTGFASGLLMRLRPAGQPDFGPFYHLAFLPIDPHTLTAAADGQGGFDLAWQVTKRSVAVDVAPVTLDPDTATISTLGTFPAKPGKSPTPPALSDAGGHALVAWAAGKHAYAALREPGSATFAAPLAISGNEAVAGDRS